MPKHLEEIPLTLLRINFSSEIPLYKQLYNNFRQSILEGKLSPGQKLPGSRSLADELHISRYTVNSAYEQLMIEGYIKGKAGAGMFVNEIPDNFLNVKDNGKSKKTKKEITSKLGSYIGLIDVIRRGIAPENIIPFQTSVPSFDQYSIKTWLKLNQQAANMYSDFHLRYSDAAGYKPLREEIAKYLKTYRGVNCSTDQIIIVNGSQQGLDVIGKALLEPDDPVLIEDPGYFGMKWSMLFTYSKVLPAPLDDEGLDIEYISKNYPPPKLIYSTPSHQFPLGLTMSVSRRLQLLQYARKNNCWIIEDDYDSELRYTGLPLPSLQGMDKNGCVIYLGTFSKVLFPSLRIGYLVAPDQHTFDVLVTAKLMSDLHSPVFEQIIASLFLNHGHFTRHIRKTRMLYKSRQEILINEIKKELKGILNVNHSPAGMHLIGWLPKNLDDKIFAAEAIKNQLLVLPLSLFSIKFFKDPGLILGYTAFDGKDIREGVIKLKRVLEKFL